MSAATPWWASEETHDRIDGTQDPFRAHRAARQPDEHAVPEQLDWVSTLGDVAVGVVKRLQEANTARADRAHEHGVGDSDVCRNCPVCTLLRAVDRSGPEISEHLGDAARHLALAAASFLEAIAERPADDLSPEQQR